jgi:1-acyl-sn-glycerol-3-phosphate acyltransferase
LKLATLIVDPVLALALKIVCKLDAKELRSVPPAGPLIIIMNHINFLEVPLMYLQMKPRPALALAKKETWTTPGYGFLVRIWGGIPVDRTGADLSALKRAEEHLARGGIIMLAPEGTRSGNGILKEGHAGVVTLASRSGAPVMPVAHFGGERFWPNLKRFRRTKVSFKAGPIYQVDFGGATVTGSKRREALSELMAALALLMPPEYHGIYREKAEQCRNEGYHWLKIRE